MAEDYAPPKVETWPKIVSLKGAMATRIHPSSRPVFACDWPGCRIPARWVVQEDATRAMLCNHHVGVWNDGPMVESRCIPFRPVN